MMLEELDVIIVGAGAAGIGCGAVLKDLGVSRYALLERETIGASFMRWPAETRFISPSFTSNGFGLLDLNAIALNTSPAYTLGSEHPTGREYAHYLRQVAAHLALPIREGFGVRGVVPQTNGFLVETSQGPIYTKFLIWAAGEFAYPRRYPFQGAELCQHSSEIGAWGDMPGSEFIVIGGGESGVDAALHLAASGRSVVLLDRGTIYKERITDPSLGLSPHTLMRMRAVQEMNLIRLRDEADVVSVCHTTDGYCIQEESGERWTTRQPPILASGFESSLSLIFDLLDWDEEDQPRLTNVDESTRVPGLFVSGPMVRQNGAIFCFIYKFRQRFAVIGEKIAQRLGLDTAPLTAYAAQNMFLKDLSCCTANCAC